MRDPCSNIWLCQVNDPYGEHNELEDHQMLRLEDLLQERMNKVSNAKIHKNRSVYKGTVFTCCGYCQKHMTGHRCFSDPRQNQSSLSPRSGACRSSLLLTCQQLSLHATLDHQHALLCLTYDIAHEKLHVNFFYLI